jgi:hypothetical protein
LPSQAMRRPYGAAQWERLRMRHAFDFPTNGTGWWRFSVITMPNQHRNPTAAERDERVKIDLDPDVALEALLFVDLNDEPAEPKKKSVKKK